MSRFVILQKAILIPKNTFMRSIRNSGMGKCVYLHAQGWGIDHQERTNLQISGGVPGGGGTMRYIRGGLSYLDYMVMSRYISVTLE